MKNGSKRTEMTGKVLPFNLSGESYYRKGMTMYHRGQLDKALKYLTRAQDLEPEEPMIRLQMAIIETEIGEFKQSNERLKEIMDTIDPSMIEAHYLMANNFAHLGLFGEAYKHATAYLDRHGDGEFVEDAEDLLELLSLEEENEFDRDLEQDELIMHQEKANQHLADGEFKEAIELLEEVIERFPDYWTAYNNLALAYFYFGEKEQATALLTEVLNRNPGNLHALCNLAVFYYYQERTDELENLMDALEQVRPFLLEHRFKLGATFSLVGRHKQAYGWLKSLVKRGFEGDAGFYFWLSQSAWQTGHEKVAKEAWKRVLIDQPDKEGMEPWNGQMTERNDVLSESMYPEERLFVFFKEAQTDPSFLKVGAPSYLTETEHAYFAVLGQVHNILSDTNAVGPKVDALKRAHDVACKLSHTFNLTQQSHQGLFYMWFHIVYYGSEDGYSFKNVAALSAAVEYLWKKVRGEKVSQREMAEKYSTSTSSMRAYMDDLNEYLP
ncbi:tetratricopeptide repeat protein [Jeotgalibacillus marinus]|uniref:Tetratricopeptide repeat protein n=1 Tax=Jeotgalibacillus marinus TaxID=86667 RepID=A0ABV3Q441_9BACL